MAFDKSIIIVPDFAPLFCWGFQDSVVQNKNLSRRDHCKRYSPSRISDTPRVGFEYAQNLRSRFDEWSCPVVTTTTPRRHSVHDMMFDHIMWYPSMLLCDVCNLSLFSFQYYVTNFTILSTTTTTNYELLLLY